MHGMGPYTNAKECNEKRKQNNVEVSIGGVPFLIPHMIPNSFSFVPSFFYGHRCSTPTVSLGVFAPVGEGFRGTSAIRGFNEREKGHGILRVKCIDSA